MQSPACAAQVTAATADDCPAIAQLPLPQRLASERLVLRPPVEADAETIFEAYTQDPLVCRYMIWKPHSDIAMTREFIADCAASWSQGSRRPYVITERGDDRAIGMIEARILGATIDIGYVLARAHWGRGVMPEAIRMLAEAALAGPDVFRVHAACDTENTPSQRALEKAGFTREGRLERFTVHPNISPQPRACYMYARTR